MKAKIRIFPVISPTHLSLARLSPSKCNIRQDLTTQSSKSHQFETSPSPLYNTAILSDAHIFSHLEFLHEASKEFTGLIDATILAKVWLEQRGLGKEWGGGFLLSMLMAWLMKGGDSNRRLGRGFSSYQIFKVLMEFLGNLLEFSIIKL